MEQSKTPLAARDPVLPHCENRQVRQTLKDQLLSGAIPYEEYRETLLAERAKLPKRVEPPRMIEMALHHGDMVVMHGEGVQKYFEVGLAVHLVPPLILAACRRIRPASKAAVCPDRAEYQKRQGQGGGLAKGGLLPVTESGI